MKPKIMIVDDEESIRDLIAEFLRNDGYDIDVSDGVDTAMSFMKSKKYAIILLDKNMSGLDGKSNEGGMDLLRHIRSHLIPSEVIMMTGYATIDTAIEAMKLGAFDYLLKPFSMQDLKVKIDRILEYRGFFDSNRAIDIYKGIQGEILSLIENRSGMSNSELDNVLVSLNKKIDNLFRLLKESERFALTQRENLAHIAGYAEQLKSHVPDTYQAYSLMDEICKCADKRL